MNRARRKRALPCDRKQIMLNLFGNVRVLMISGVVLSTTPTAAGSFSGIVVSIQDGDTLDVQHHEKSERIRLNGIDTPEKGQDYGRRAKQFTEELVGDKEVSIRLMVRINTAARSAMSFSLTAGI